MRMYVSKISSLFNSISKELEDTFLGYRNFSCKMKTDLEKIGFTCKSSRNSLQNKYFTGAVKK